MNEALEQKRIMAYRAAPEHVKALYADSTTGETISAVCGATLNSALEREAIDVVGDIILGLEQKNKLADLLVEKAKITREQAGKIASNLAELLKPIAGTPPPLPTGEIPNLKERLHLRPEGAPGAAATGEPSPKPLTREELMGSLLAKRTMASDIAAVKGAGVPPAQTGGTPNATPTQLPEKNAPGSNNPQ